ncbi:hypothetical protein RND81_14G060100 [Saponaria officinalis]|uniref:Uncharacterized protein n=1 Tax=Saponaria officinalis TaxID=3572 RepID=A0AAW1GME3_SAPOF
MLAQKSSFPYETHSLTLLSSVSFPHSRRRRRSLSLLPPSLTPSSLTVDVSSLLSRRRCVLPHSHRRRSHPPLSPPLLISLSVAGLGPRNGGVLNTILKSP